MLTKSLLKNKAKAIENLKNFISKAQIKGFSSGHSASGSDTDGHDHHDDHHFESKSFYEDKKMTEPLRTIDNVKPERFDVLSMLEKLREPIKIKKSSYRSLKQEDSKTEVETQNDYANFLANAFENATLKKYPEYKKHLNEFKHLIPNFDKLNPYEKEVKTLDAYMHWTVNMLRQKSHDAQIMAGNTKLEQCKARAEFFSKITKIEEGDSHILKGLKKKLDKVVKSDLKYEQFKHDYNKELETKAINKIIEEKKLAYSSIQIVKANELSDLKSSQNPNYHPIGITPHDHIEIGNWIKNPNKIENEKDKYLALYDIIIDEHLKRVRPDGVEDDTLKYVKTEHKPLEKFYDKYTDNNVFDYVCKLDSEFYVKYKEEINKIIEDKEVTEDPNRPTDRHWNDEHKFPHVADRLGWEELEEGPLDKNMFIERLASVPIYQWQPFVQTPSLNPDINLDLEEGETLYEDKWAYEWALFWKIMILVVPVMMFILLIQVYENNAFPSHRIKSRWSINAMFPGSLHENYVENKKVEKLIYWGSDMWYWQHWVRKFLFYPTAILVVLFKGTIFRYVGSHNVLKASFNRSKDLLFVWRPGIIGKEMRVFELHHLEKPLTSIVGSWKHNGFINGNKHSYHPIIDTRTTEMFYFKENPNYWNSDLKAYFDENTSTYWNGLRSRDVNKGIFFDNSLGYTAKEQEEHRVIDEEIKAAVEKYGPLQKTDYEHDFKFQLNKRLNEGRFNLLSVAH